MLYVVIQRPKSQHRKGLFASVVLIEATNKVAAVKTAMEKFPDSIARLPEYTAAIAVEAKADLVLHI